MTKPKFANSRVLSEADIALIEHVSNVVRRAGLRPLPPKQAARVKARRRQVESIRERSNPNFMTEVIG